MIPRRGVFLCATIFVIVTSLAHGESFFALESSLSYDSFIRGDQPISSELQPRITVAPLLYSGGDFYSLFAEGRIDSGAVGNGGAQIDLQTLELEFSPLGFLTFKVGRFHYSPGPAILFRTTSFYSPTDYEALLSGDIEQSGTAADLIQGRVFFGPLYLRLTLAPTVFPVTLPEADSPWLSGFTAAPIALPDAPIMHFSIGNPLYIDGKTDAGPVGAEQISSSLEIGGTFGAIDFSVLSYSGWNRSTAVVAEGTFDRGENVVEADLRPVRYRSGVVAGTMSAVFGSTRLWLEGNHETDAAFAGTTIWYKPFTSPTVFETRPIRGDFHTIVAGGSYDFFRFPTTIIVEGNIGIPDNDLRNTMVKPPTYRSILFLVRHAAFQDRIGLNFAGLYSTEDESSLLFLSGSYRISPDASLQARVPIFFGDEETAFGRYRDVNYVSLGLRVRF